MTKGGGMVTAKEIMSKSVLTVDKDTTPNELIKTLVRERVTGLPVVDDEMCLLGVVTEQDILKMLYNKEKSKTVQELMTRDVVTFDQDDDLINIFKCLVNNSFRRVPVMSKGRLVGIISRRDIIKFLSRKLD
jgi:CBS domain-containing protein